MERSYYRTIVELKLVTTFDVSKLRMLLSNHCGIETPSGVAFPPCDLQLLSNHCGIETL